MRVMALIEGPGHVCWRYRIEAFGPALAKHGGRIEPRPIERSTPRRLAQLAAARRADVVILQRKLLPLWQLALLRRAARRLVYDFDDAVFCRDSFQPKPQESWQRRARFWATVYVADAVLAGNDHLRRQAAAYVEAQRVWCIPTCVDPSKYALAAHHRTGGAIRLVWIGQRSTTPSLRLIQPHLLAAARRLPGLELRILSDRFPELEGIVATRRPWSAATEAQELAQADVGISWLPDDAWSRGKCGLKVLQYMAAGLPVVANPVGVHQELVIPGCTGFLASTPEQWARFIGRLAENPGLRRALGQAGRRLVQQRYAVDVWAERFAAVILATTQTPQEPAWASDRRVAHDTLDLADDPPGVNDDPPGVEVLGDTGGRGAPSPQRLLEAHP